MSIESRLEQMGIQLRAPAEPAGNYFNYVQTGNLLYLAGAGPMRPGRPLRDTAGYRSAHS